VRQGSDLYLQYWLFYYHDDSSVFGAGEHEGDWELIQVRLSPDGTPVDVFLSHRAELTLVSWPELQLADLHAPIVYVTRGSHSNHAQPGKYGGLAARDRADGRGRIVRPVLERFGEGWVAWPGLWGATKGDGPLLRNSPRGPRFHVAWGDPSRHHAGGTAA
jgi:hypothetical protein